jgi:hypothetical protein
VYQHYLHLGYKLNIVKKPLIVSIISSNLRDDFDFCILRNKIEDSLQPSLYSAYSNPTSVIGRIKLLSNFSSLCFFFFLNNLIVEEGKDLNVLKKP